MGNTTFNGPVRSENGFSEISIDATTGAVTELNRTKTIQATSGTIAVTHTTNTDVSVGEQPAGTFIKDIILYNSVTFTNASGGSDDFDVSIGTAAGGAQLLGATALIDGASKTWAATTPIYLIENSRGHALDKFTHTFGGPNKTEAIAPAGNLYTATARDIHVRFTPLNTNMAAAGGTIKVTVVFQYA
jgi:hypothetical protein